MACTGSSASRRALLRALTLAPAAALLPAPPADATDYASAAAVLAAIARAEAEVDARLAAVVAARPSAAPFGASVHAARARHRAERARLRIAKGAGRSVAAAPAVDASLSALRQAQEDLVHAYAEGLPALHDADAVDVLGRQMVDLARQLTVLELWVESEEQGG